MDDAPTSPSFAGGSDAGPHGESRWLLNRSVRFSKPTVQVHVVYLALCSSGWMCIVPPHPPHWGRFGVVAMPSRRPPRPGGRRPGPGEPARAWRPRRNTRFCSVPCFAVALPPVVRVGQRAHDSVTIGVRREGEHGRTMGVLLQGVALASACSTPEEQNERSGARSSGMHTSQRNWRALEDITGGQLEDGYYFRHRQVMQDIIH